MPGRKFSLCLTAMLVWLGAAQRPLAAQDVTQDNPDASQVADSQLLGAVHAANGVGVPGSTVRITETSSGKAWVTWTEEDGKFKFPALSAGHYHVEVSQLGFTSATQDIDLASGSTPTIDVKLDVGTLAAISAPPATDAARTAPSTPQPASNETAKAAPGGAPSSGSTPSGAPTTPNQSASAANAPGGPQGQGGRNGGPRVGGSAGGRNGPQGGGPGGPTAAGGRRAFQQLGLSGQGQNSDEGGGMEDQSATASAGGQLGQAASADAVQMIGTVAMGQMPAEGTFVQFGDGGPGGFGPGDRGIPGQGPPGGPVVVGPGGGPGGVAGGPGGPGGGGVVFYGGGGGGRGRGRGPRGPGGPPAGVDALWGVDRLNRIRANQVHFSFYDTYGNSALNARPYSLSEPNPPKIASWTESAGMNIGGPLKIPHVYNGTDKTFFFINFGGTWSRTPVDQFATVPTAAERPSLANPNEADFSGNLGALLYTKGGVTTTDPSGTALMVTDTNGQMHQAREGMIFNPTNHEQYAGNILTGPFSPVAFNTSPGASSLLNYTPAENLPGQRLNYHLQSNLPGISNRLNINVTHQISEKVSLQVNYNLSDGTSHSLSNFADITGNSYNRGQSAMIGLTQNWTKSLVHTSQFYFSRQRTLATNGFTNVTDIASQLGILGSSPANYDFGLPSIGFTNFTGINDPNFSLARSQTYRYVDSLRWIKEKHTLTIGGEVRKMDINRDTDPAPNGQFSFTGGSTSLLTSAGFPDEASQTGSDFADFLLGYAANAKLQYGDTATYFRNWGFIGYVTDDWHIVPKFTLTYGVRYEAFTPPTEINGHIANLNVANGFSSPTCVTPVATNLNGLNCAAGATASLFGGHYNNWAPRLGIAWQPPGKWFAGNHQMTVRAGFSMFYVEAYLNTLSAQLANQPPFAIANLASSQTVPNLGFGTDLSQLSKSTTSNTVAVDPNYKVPYAMIWNLGIEYDLAPRTFLEVMYTGTRGVHLDQLFGYTFPASGTSPGAAFTYDTSGAFSNLNSLQVRLQKRRSHGVMFMARYTYSKSLDDASTIGGGAQTVIQNNADPLADYGLSSFNLTHQFLGMFSYDLPFGDHHRLAPKGWQKNVFGEWRVNGFITANSGTPYTVRVFSKNQACLNVPGVNSARADQVASAALVNPTIQEWFNTAAFAVPTACYGDAARNSVIGPGSFNINSGLAKSVFLGKDGLRRLDFTWNASNLLNHPNFGGLSTVLGSATFGQITSVGAMRSMTFTTRVNF